MFRRSRSYRLVVALAALRLGGLAPFWLFPPRVNAAAPRVLPLGLHAAFLADYQAEARVMRLPALPLNLVRDALPRHAEAALQRLATPIPTPTPQGPAAQPTNAGWKAPTATATPLAENPPLPSATPLWPSSTSSASPSATPTASATVAPYPPPPGSTPQPTASPLAYPAP